MVETWYIFMCLKAEGDGRPENVEIGVRVE